MRRRFARNPHRFFGRGLRLKKGPGVRGLRMGARGGCFVGDLLTHRLTPSFGGALLLPKSFGGFGFRKSGADAYGRARNFSAPHFPISLLAVSEKVSDTIGARDAGIRGFGLPNRARGFGDTGPRAGRCRLYGRNSDCPGNLENPEIEISGRRRRVPAGGLQPRGAALFYVAVDCSGRRVLRK